MKQVLKSIILSIPLVFSNPAAQAQDCQTSHDYEDLMGEDFIPEHRFRCGTSMMEDRHEFQQAHRERLGYSNIEGLSFWDDDGYYQKEGDLYYSANLDSFLLIPDGDVKSIKQLGPFIKDKNHVYVKGIAQENA